MTVPVTWPRGGKNARRIVSGGPLPPSPPAEKANARQDQAGKASTGDGAGYAGRIDDDRQALDGEVTQCATVEEIEKAVWVVDAGGKSEALQCSRYRRTELMRPPASTYDRETYMAGRRSMRLRHMPRTYSM